MITGFNLRIDSARGIDLGQSTVLPKRNTTAILSTRSSHRRVSRATATAGDQLKRVAGDNSFLVRGNHPNGYHTAVRADSWSLNRVRVVIQLDPGPFRRLAYALPDGCAMGADAAGKNQRVQAAECRD